jgi:hypothetical protein
VYLTIVTGAPAPLELLEWDLAERFGWTLDYIGILPMSRLHQFLQIEDGRGHARSSTVRGKL